MKKIIPILICLAFFGCDQKPKAADPVTLKVLNDTAYNDNGEFKLAYRCLVKNNTPDSITAIKGWLKVTNVFGDPLEKYALLYDAGVSKAGAQVLFYFSYDENKAGDYKIAHSTFDKLKFEWQTIEVKYKSGKDSLLTAN